jgi:hypothetical protein
MTRTFDDVLEQGIGWGILALVIIMPFHAFLSVWLGSLSGHQNLIQAWKELLVIILVLATAALIYRQPARLARGGQLLPYSALAFGAIALIITAIHPQTISAILYGIKTDFEYIVLFFVALYGASKSLYLKLPFIILLTSAIVAAFGILHATVLPHDILTHVGYGPTTVAPYQFVGSLSDTIRTPSTLGGPNQLGSFLILPLVLALALWIRKPRWILVLAGLLYTACLWYTYSRSAWVGAAVAVGVTIGALITTRLAALRLGLAALILVVLGSSLLVVGASHTSAYEYFVLHSGAGVETNNSTTQHASALKAGLLAVQNQPFGQGLGSAGPASFHADTALIPENYYLQIAIETGILGLIAFTAFILAAGLKLWHNRHEHVLVPALIGALAGISVVNLFLHGWADSSTALIYWSVAGATLAGSKRHV